MYIKYKQDHLYLGINASAFQVADTQIAYWNNAKELTIMYVQATDVN